MGWCWDRALMTIVGRHDRPRSGRRSPRPWDLGPNRPRFQPTPAPSDVSTHFCPGAIGSVGGRSGLNPARETGDGEDRSAPGPDPGTWQTHGVDTSGAVVLAGTPIGDAEDAPPRLLRLLAEADVVAAEDTRRLRALVARLGVT